ncbi:MAG: hypothetical protein LBE72_01855 [Rickettsia sp.]|nr:hypothetical protein [Rickettsia sp.]
MQSSLKGRCSPVKAQLATLDISCELPAATSLGGLSFVQESLIVRLSISASRYSLSSGLGKSSFSRGFSFKTSSLDFCDSVAIVSKSSLLSLLQLRVLS